MSEVIDSNLTKTEAMELLLAMKRLRSSDIFALMGACGDELIRREGSLTLPQQQRALRRVQAFIDACDRDIFSEVR